MESTFTRAPESEFAAALARWLAQPAPEPPVTPFPAPGRDAAADAADAFDAQILAALVSP